MYLCYNTCVWEIKKEKNYVWHDFWFLCKQLIMQNYSKYHGITLTVNDNIERINVKCHHIKKLFAFSRILYLECFTKVEFWKMHLRSITLTGVFNWLLLHLECWSVENSFLEAENFPPQKSSNNWGDGCYVIRGSISLCILVHLYRLLLRLFLCATGVKCFGWFTVFHLPN